MADDIARILFGDQNEPLAELAPYNAGMLEGYQALPLTPALRGYLSVFTQAASSLRMGLAGRTYTLSFKPGVLEQASGLMRAREGGQYAIAINRHGRILGQGKLVPTSGVGALTSAMAVWQVMSLVTAQVYLDEINERLREIERGIDAIRAWLEADKIATLLNAQRYVAELRDAFATRSLTEHDMAGFQQQLERLWVDCGQVETALRLLLDQQAEQFRQLDLGSFWGLDSQVAAAQGGIARYERLAQAYLLSLRTRAVLVCGRAALPLSQEITAQRIQLLHDALRQHNAREQHFFTVARTHVRERLGATLHIGTTDGTYRGKVLGAAVLAEGALWRVAIDVLANINAIEQRRDTQRLLAETDYTLILTLDAQGEIAKVFPVHEG